MVLFIKKLIFPALVSLSIGVMTYWYQITYNDVPPLNAMILAIVSALLTGAVILAIEKND